MYAVSITIVPCVSNMLKLRLRNPFVLMLLVGYVACMLRLRRFWKKPAIHSPSDRPTNEAAAMSETDRFDGMLMNIAQAQHGIEPLLDTVFSFLRRKTDFFTGASPEVIENTILNCVRKQASLAEKAQFEKKQQEEAKRKKLAKQKAEKEAKEAALKKQKQQEKEVPRFEEITDDEPVAAAAAAVASPVAKPVKEEEKKEDEEDDGPRT